MQVTRYECPQTERGTVSVIRMSEWRSQRSLIYAEFYRRDYRATLTVYPPVLG